MSWASLTPFFRGALSQAQKPLPDAFKWLVRRPLQARVPSFICISPDPNEYSGARLPETTLAEYNICFGLAAEIEEKFPDAEAASRANYVVTVNRGRGRMSRKNDLRAGKIYAKTSPWMRFVYEWDDLYPHKAPGALVGALNKYSEYNLGTDIGIKLAVQDMQSLLEDFGELENAEEDVSDSVIFHSVSKSLPPMEYLQRP